MRTTVLLRTVWVLVAAGVVNASGCSNTQAAKGDVVTAEGWHWRLVTNDIHKPRSIQFDSKGGLLVLEADQGLSHLELEDKGGTCFNVKKKTRLVDNGGFNHGLALSNDGRTVYASTDNDVFAWNYDPDKGALDTASQKTVTTNMKNPDGGHASRTLFASQVNPGWLVVSRGSQGNDDPIAENLASGHCQIRAFQIGDSANIPQGGYNWSTDGRLLGWGLRNSVGVTEHPNGDIWSVENSSDEMLRNGTDIHVDNPAEEVNWHGSPARPAEGQQQGGNYGYPVCFAVWDPSKLPNIGSLTTGDNVALDRQAPNVLPSNDTACNADFVRPELVMQPHSAPLDIKFNKNGTTAYVTQHGSWNRPDPAGYAVGTIDWDANTGRPRAGRTDQHAFNNIMSNKDLSKCPGGCFRPVGLAFDSQDRLFVSSDTTNEIYVLLNGRDPSQGGAGRATVPVLGVVAASVGVLWAVFV